MFNFLAMLGWSPGGNQELYTRDELVRAFALEGISGGNAVFNPEKLDWFNQQHIALLPPIELARRLEPLLSAAGLWKDEYLGDRHAWFFAVIELLKPRVKRLDDFVVHGRFFLTDAIEYDRAAVDKHVRVEGMREHLAALDAAFARLEHFDQTSVESAVRATAEARGVKAAVLIHAIRVTVTGKAVSPGLFEVLALLGPAEVRRRLAEMVELVGVSGS
jgi:glutamyl-tRNA synthetase